MIAVDANILVYAHRVDSPWHQVAKQCVAALAEGSAPWAIPWPCVHEFFGIVTHARIYNPPTPAATALDRIQAWAESPTITLLAESAGYWEELKATLQQSKISGPKVHDAHIAALCRLHGVSELWSADRDFNRFAGLAVRNPLVK